MSPRKSMSGGETLQIQMRTSDNALKAFAANSQKWIVQASECGVGCGSQGASLPLGLKGGNNLSTSDLRDS